MPLTPDCKSCNTCQHYRPLARPEDYPGLGYTMYGFCDKDNGKGPYPVYIPGAKCKGFQPKEATP